MPAKPKSKLKTSAAKVKAKLSKKKTVEDKPVTNKEIAYAYIVRHMHSIRPNPTVIAAIAGAKFRSNGNRLQKISDMIAEHSSKLTKRLKALLEKRGHEDIAAVIIDTTTKDDDCDTDGTPPKARDEDEEEDKDEDAEEADEETEDE